MPKGWVRGPQGQMRPLAPGARARMVMDILTGKIKEDVEKPDIAGPDEDDGSWFPIYGSGLPPPPRPVAARRAEHKKAAARRERRSTRS